MGEKLRPGEGGFHSTVTEIHIFNHHPLVLLLHSPLDFLWSFMSGFMKCLHQCLISHVGQQAEPFGQLLAHLLAIRITRVHPAEDVDSDLSFQEAEDEETVFNIQT